MIIFILCILFLFSTPLTLFYQFVISVNIYSWHSESDESLDSLHYVKSLERSPEAVSRSSSRSTNNTSVCTSVHVLPILRLLVALEDHLGSLGPKVVDLLTEALKLEKVSHGYKVPKTYES